MKLSHSSNTTMYDAIRYPMTVPVLFSSQSMPCVNIMRKFFGPQKCDIRKARWSTRRDSSLKLCIPCGISSRCRWNLRLRRGKTCGGVPVIFRLTTMYLQTCLSHDSLWMNVLLHVSFNKLDCRTVLLVNYFYIIQSCLDCAVFDLYLYPKSIAKYLHVAVAYMTVPSLYYSQFAFTPIHPLIFIHR